MNKNKAARILLQQTKKPLEEGFDINSWKTQSSSFIETFFGKDSDEYKSLYKPTVKFYSGYETENERRQSRNLEIQSICSILKSCSETIKIKGTYRQPNQNIVGHLNNYALLGIAITLIGFGFYSHKFLVDITNKTNQHETSLQSNHSLIRDSNKINKVVIDSSKRH